MGVEVKKNIPFNGVTRSANLITRDHKRNERRQPYHSPAHPPVSID